MGSEDTVPSVEKVNATVEASLAGACHGKKIQKKVPKRLHKAEREKQKREQLNELFINLSSALELKESNNGKASILNEASRLLKDLLAQIECLRKENATLLSESNYVTTEKNELREDNSTLENQIGKLQDEIKARVIQSKPDLNAPPPDCLTMPGAEPSLGQTHAVFVVPIRPDLQGYPVPEASQLTSNPTSNVRKPHARYPTSVDTWPSQLLSEQLKASKDFPTNDINSSILKNRERVPDNL
ncbi:hypothetical protein UlMin_008230 [Ulmus minor]